jgi:hypothetical protein
MQRNREIGHELAPRYKEEDRDDSVRPIRHASQRWMVREG